MLSVRSGSFQETGWQAICQTLRKRLSRCLQPRASVPSGPVAARSWVPPLSWIVSAKSNRRYCSPPTGTSTKVRSSIFFLTSKKVVGGVPSLKKVVLASHIGADAKAGDLSSSVAFDDLTKSELGEARFEQ